MYAVARNRGHGDTEASVRRDAAGNGGEAVHVLRAAPSGLLEANMAKNRLPEGRRKQADSR